MNTDIAYAFSISKHILGGVLNADRMVDSIDSAASGVKTKLLRLDINPQGNDPDRFELWFARPLDLDESYALGALVAEHDGTPNTQPPLLVHTDQPTNPDGIPFAIPKASGLGYVLNDRDVLICTGVMANAYEDWKVDVATGERVDWEEIDFLGCHKVGSGGALVPCVDQADADQHAICSIWEYQARLNGQAISVEIRGGSLFVDAEEKGLGGDLATQRQHQIYAVAAPNIPAVSGGQNRFFDGYLMGYKQDWMPAVSSDAMRLDPTDGTQYGIPYGEASKLRVYVYYPVGSKHHHILRLITYRWIGSF